MTMIINILLPVDKPAKRYKGDRTRNNKLMIRVFLEKLSPKDKEEIKPNPINKATSLSSPNRLPNLEKLR